MEERVDVLVPYGYADVRISTFHAFGDWLLREHALELGLTPAFRVLNRAEQVLFLRTRLFELPLDHFRPLGDPTRHLQALTGLFGRAKDEDVTPEAYLAHAAALAAEAAAHPDDAERRDLAARTLELARTYAAYRDLMAREGFVDFGDQIYLALRLFRERPYVLANYQKRFRYVLVDEFQDTNHAQFELVKLLVSRHRNVTVVGDDDQAIFRFRGASMSNILGFDADVPGRPSGRARPELPLGPARAGRRLSAHQEQRPGSAGDDAGDRQAAAGGRGAGGTRAGAHGLRDGDPGGGRRRADDQGGGEGRPASAYRDFAILVRANADADPFLRSLNMHGIPWTFSGNQGLYGRAEVRLCIAFLRVIARPDDSVSLYSPRGLGEDLRGAGRRSGALRRSRGPPEPVALRRAPRPRRDARAARGSLARRGRSDRAPGEGARAFHGAGGRARHRRAALPVPRGQRLAGADVAGGHRPRGGRGPERRAVLPADSGCGPGPAARPRPRVREAPRRADRGRRGSGGRRGGRRRARRADPHGAQGQGARVSRRVRRGTGPGTIPVAEPRRRPRAARRPPPGPALVG